MIVDNTPAIRAFVIERLKLHVTGDTGVNRTGVDELTLILNLCNGLLKQTELLEKAMNKGTEEA